MSRAGKHRWRGEDVKLKNRVRGLVGDVKISGCVQRKRAGSIQTGARGNQHGRRGAAGGNEFHIAIAGGPGFSEVDICFCIHAHRAWIGERSDERVDDSRGKDRLGSNAGPAQADGVLLSAGRILDGQGEVAGTGIGRVEGH